MDRLLFEDAGEAQEPGEERNPRPGRKKKMGIQQPTKAGVSSSIIFVDVTSVLIYLFIICIYASVLLSTDDYLWRLSPVSCTGDVRSFAWPHFLLLLGRVTHVTSPLIHAAAALGRLLIHVASALGNMDPCGFGPWEFQESRHHQATRGPKR